MGSSAYGNEISDIWEISGPRREAKSSFWFFFTPVLLAFFCLWRDGNWELTNGVMDKWALSANPNQRFIMDGTDGRIKMGNVDRTRARRSGMGNRKGMGEGVYMEFFFINLFFFHAMMDSFDAVQKSLFPH